MTPTTTVTVLGTGIMGSAMARNLAAAGFTTRAWNRTPDRAAPLAQAGVTVFDSVTDAVAGADVVLTMLFDGQAVTDVMSQAAPAMRPGAAWVQCTTVSVAHVAECAQIAAEHDLAFYDSPVSGTRGPAEAGTLVLIAAGPSDSRVIVQPVFDVIGSRTVWTGTDGGAGTSTALKLVVNSWVIAVSNSAGEAVALARAFGLDPTLFLEVLNGGPLDLPFLRVKVGLIVDEQLTPANFAVDTSGKDAHLIAESAQAAGLHLDGAEAFAARLARVSQQGRDAEDMAAAFFASFPEGIEPTR